MNGTKGETADFNGSTESLLLLPVVFENCRDCTDKQHFFCYENSMKTQRNSSILNSDTVLHLHDHYHFCEVLNALKINIKNYYALEGK